MDFSILYFVIGFLVGGAFFANRLPHMPRPSTFDFLPPVYRLGLLCFLFALIWPAFLVMVLGYFMYKFVVQ